MDIMENLFCEFWLFSFLIVLEVGSFCCINFVSFMFNNFLFNSVIIYVVGKILLLWKILKILFLNFVFIDFGVGLII